jgi:hypothetical protein
VPYIAAEDRPRLDRVVDALADELASELWEKMNGDTEIASCYKQAFLTVAEKLRGLQGGGRQPAQSKAEELAFEIFTGAERHGYRGAWVGGLDYALTRLIQRVPVKMVERKAWGEEFRFWVYIQTSGALERAAMRVHSEGGDDDWVADALVAVLTDVKDEYKRRVNTAYEAIQIRRSGDCYTTPYRTEVVEVKDGSNGVIGYTEVMKEFGGPRTKNPHADRE